tara:strand:- start:46 stop:426 length:381 start_codon:yes stop_codon:yes gene_type:complete
MRYTHDSWSVDLPKHWAVEDSEQCVTLYDPDGFGAFQISSYLKEDGDVTIRDLLDFAEVENTESTNLPYLHGIFKKIIDGEDTTFNWWLFVANHLLYATYTSSTKDESAEAVERDSIIHSLRSHYA